MKKFFLFTNLFILCLVMGFFAHATDVGGLILEDTTWAKAGSPYVVIDDVTVVGSVTLTIEPGVEVKFNEKLALIIDGTLIARGTNLEDEKILFTSNGNQTPGYWGYILFTDTSKDAIFNPGYTGGCIIQYAIVQYGGSGKRAITTDRSSPFIDNSVITNNNGAIYVNGDSPVISNCEIKNNSATDGGGIYISSGAPIIQNSTISENPAADDGGGIYATSSGTVTIQNSTISGNSADDGGGIYATSSGTITIQNSAISENTAFDDGGGIYASGSTVNIQNSTISGNSASFLDGGGGIYASGSTVTVQNSTISGNSAKYYTGGGIYAISDSTVTIEENSIISGNSADDGGGIYAYRGTITIQNSAISGNSAKYYTGGGIYAADSTVNIKENSTISENTADDGGGIYATSSGTVTIQNSTISENTAADNGGGIYASGSTVNIQNSTISGNFGYSGGGLYASSGTVTIKGNRITQNTNTAIPSSSAGTLYLRNLKTGSIIGGDSCNLIKDNNGAGVYIVGTVPINYNDIYNNTGYSLVCGNPAGAPEIDATNNYWGTDKESVIEALILDCLDDPNLGCVNYKPFLTDPCVPDVGTINGHVTNLAGNPIEFAIVIAINIGTKEKTWDITDVDGYYEIQELPPGMYLLIAIKKGYKAGIAKVEVEAGGTTTKDFKLRPKSGEDDEDEFTDLYANYPNPFNPDTWIPYYLSQDADVTIRIYNSAGQLVRTLDLGRQVADIYMDKDKAAYWDGKDDLGQQVASGVYYYTLRAGNFSATRKMILMK